LGYFHACSFHIRSILIEITESRTGKKCINTRAFTLVNYVTSMLFFHVVAGQEAVVRTARSLFSVVEKANDEASADLLTQRIQLHEKTAWMLRSLLE
jgi:DNA-binding ferritin-like protein